MQGRKELMNLPPLEWTNDIIPTGAKPIQSGFFRVPTSHNPLSIAVALHNA
jgi:hypothetical protein